MKFRENCKWAIVCPTSMGVRITPVNRQPVHVSSLFEMQATSAESNVLSIAAALGQPTKVLTAFVKGSPIASLIKGDLRRRGISYEGPEVEKGDAWGYRHQFNIADSGFGLRGPRVDNDRAGEVGRTLNVKDFDLHRLFVEEGVQVLHISGLIGALSHETSEFCLQLAEAAHAAGTRISFDLNYRASFWKGRETELRDIFTRIAQKADILVGNEEDFQLALGIEGPKSGGKDIASKIESFQGMIRNVKKAFPNAGFFGTTLRQVVSANEHLWGAILLDGEEWHVIEPRPIQVYDRIGGGDAFVGGMLYGMVKGWDGEKCAQFGWATGALVATLETDFGLPADEEQVWSIWEGNARVKR